MNLNSIPKPGKCPEEEVIHYILTKKDKNRHIQYCEYLYHYYQLTEPVKEALARKDDEFDKKRA